MENNIIMLTEEQRNVLETFAKNGVHSTHLVKRARVILMLDRSGKEDHLRINQIMERVDLSRQAVNNIRNAFMTAPTVDTFLTRKKRETPPVPAKVTGEVEAHIIALACSEPPEGYARWNLRLLAEKSVELQFIDNISYMSIDRVLKKRNLSLT